MIIMKNAPSSSSPPLLAAQSEITLGRRLPDTSSSKVSVLRLETPPLLAALESDAASRRPLCQKLSKSHLQHKRDEKGRKGSSLTNKTCFSLECAGRESVTAEHGALIRY